MCGGPRARPAHGGGRPGAQPVPDGGQPRGSGPGPGRAHPAARGASERGRCGDAAAQGPDRPGGRAGLPPGLGRDQPLEGPPGGLPALLGCRPLPCAPAALDGALRGAAQGVPEPGPGRDEDRPGDQHRRDGGDHRRHRLRHQLGPAQGEELRRVHGCFHAADGLDLPGERAAAQGARGALPPGRVLPPLQPRPQRGPGRVSAPRAEADPAGGDRPADQSHAGEERRRRQHCGVPREGRGAARGEGRGERRGPSPGHRSAGARGRGADGAREAPGGLPAAPAGRQDAPVREPLRVPGPRPDRGLRGGLPRPVGHPGRHPRPPGGGRRPVRGRPARRGGGGGGTGAG